MPFNQRDELGKIQYGVTPRTSDEILGLMNERLLTNLSEALGEPTVIDTSESSEVGRLNRIFSDRLAALWQETEDIEGSFYVSDAFGVSLSKLALLVGFVRNSSTYSVGEIRAFGDDKTVVPAETTYASIRGEEFINISDYELTLEACLSFNTTVGVNKSGREYSITIDDKKYSIISSTDDHYQILSSLASALAAEPTVTVTLSPDLDEDSFLTVTKIQQPDTTLPMKAEVSSLLLPNNVQVEQVVRAKNKGVVFGDADTVIEILNTVSGLDSVYNPRDFELGSEMETDEELRARIVTDYNSVGSGTATSIEAKLGSRDSVRSVRVDENRLFTTNAGGVPAKAYEVVISHLETDESIAKAIWDTKPAGIATHGVTTVVIKDSNDDDQTIKFTNATELFAHVRVQYKTTTDEGEVFPVDGEQIIKYSVAAEGDTHEINQDVIGKRFYAPIFENVEGVSELIIQVCLLPAPTTNPTDPLLVWTDKAAVSKTQIATFATNRVFVYNIT